MNWVKDWTKTLKPGLIRQKEALLAKVTPETSGGPSDAIAKIDAAIIDGDTKHRNITKYARDLIQKGDQDVANKLDTYIEKSVSSSMLLESSVVKPELLPNDRAGQRLLPDNRDPNASADVDADIGRTVEGEGFTTEVSGGTVTRDDGTRIAEGAAVEPITDEAGIASEGDARVERHTSTERTTH